MICSANTEASALFKRSHVVGLEEHEPVAIDYDEISRERVEHRSEARRDEECFGRRVGTDDDRLRSFACLENHSCREIRLGARIAARCHDRPRRCAPPRG